LANDLRLLRAREGDPLGRRDAEQGKTRQKDQASKVPRAPSEAPDDSRRPARSLSAMAPSSERVTWDDPDDPVRSHDPMS
jgi:hypothetical protein